MRSLALLAFIPIWVAGVRPAAASAQGAGACDTIVFRTPDSSFSGATIRSLTLRTHWGDPDDTGWRAVARRLHVRTRESTIRQSLLFAPGDTVDTLRVAESLRRLRARPYLNDASITARSCEGSPDIDLTVNTNDAWSIKTTVQTGSRNDASVSITERNLMGTGREASFQLRSDQSRLGAGAGYHDPWFLEERLSFRIGGVTYRDGNEWYAQIMNSERSVLDPRRAEFNFAKTRRSAVRTTSTVVDRISAGALYSRAQAPGRFAVTSVVMGAEGERTVLEAAPRSVIIGPREVRREFVGLDLGVARRSIAYDTLTWLLPSGAIVDLPLAVEGELILGLGRDLSRDDGALHLDGWAGKIWLPGLSMVVMGDVWANGYFMNNRVSAASLRGSATAFRGAAGGHWTARLGAERILAPDPDIWALSLFDPTLPAVPDPLRLANSVFSASLERTVRLGPKAGSWGFGLGFYGAASARMGPERESSELVGIGVVGAGLRLLPSRSGRSVVRLDLGIPFAKAGTTASEYVVSVSIDPFLGGLRQRQGRREY